MSNLQYDEIELHHETQDESNQDDPRADMLVDNSVREPADKNNLVYCLFVFLGLGILVPWITMLNAVDYFKILYPNYNFEFNVSIAYMIPGSITLVLVIIYGNRFPFTPRILLGYIMFAAMFALIYPLQLAQQPVGFAFTMFIACSFGFGDGVTQGSLYGFAGLFQNPHYMQALQTGTGTAGVMVSISRIITKAALPNTKEGIEKSALAYFLVSAAIMIGCVFAFLYLLRLPLTKATLNKVFQNGDTEALGQEPKDEIKFQEKEWRKNLRVGYFSIFRKVRKPALMVFANFFVTLLVFPGLITEIPSMEGKADTWFPVFMITLFNFGDFFGKIVPRFFLVNNVSLRALYIITASRYLFVPLFILCVKPRLFELDLFPMLFITIFAVLNGYIGSRGMMLGPQQVELHEREVSGTIMAFSLVSGLTLGAVCGWVFPYLL